MSREALVIGINSYKHFPPLEAPAEDAEKIAQLLEGPGEFTVQRLPGFSDPLDDNARRIAQRKEVLQIDLQRAIATLFKPASERQIPDTALLYFSGHGWVDDIGIEEGFLASSDTAPEGSVKGLSLKWLRELLAESPVRQQIVWIDACHSGALMDVKQADPREAGKVRDRCFIASSRDYQKSYTAIGSPYSVVTKALLEGLDPQRFPDRWLNNYDLISYLISEALQGEVQRPTYTNFGEVIQLTRTLAAQAAVGVEPKPVDETCPYQGLQFFTAATAKWYRGRDRLVDELLQKLGESAFVPVIGASGCGKSSLVRAGLLPVVEKRGWEILGPILPGGGLLSPADKVADLLLKRFDDPDEADEVQALLATGNLCAAVRRVPGEQQLLLVVDQYEELFTRVASEDARQKFVRLLAGAAAETAGRLRIVTTMRADFMDRFLSYRELADLATKDRICWVGPMDEAQLRDAIAEPAAINGYQLDPLLLEDILRDVEAEPNSLPLLEFALTLLWEKRDRNQHRLTIDAYRTLGRLKGALDRHAEAIFNEAGIKDNQDAYQRLRLTTDEERQWAQRIFRRLVRTLPGTKDTRQRQLRSEILDLGRCDTDRKVIEKVLGKFEQGRLLVGVEDESHLPYVDLAHEALIEGWIRFAGWRKEDPDVQRLVDRIVDAYNGWQAAPIADQHKFLLPEGVAAQVEAAIAIGDYLSNQQEAFVQQSLYIYKPWLSPEFVIETVEIPGGKFKMGSPEDQGDRYEKPEHEVSVAAFHLGKYLVTQAQWRAVALSPKVDRDLSLNPSYARGDRLPVEQVSWHDAIEFCARLSQLKGETYRLPSEAEWEYACRAGSAQAYCFGDDAGQLDDYGWYGNNSGNSPLDADRLWQEANQDANQYTSRLNANGNRTHPVGEKKPNAWGLYDMHGNVWEWCEDKWHDNYEDAPDDGRAWTSGSDAEPRLLRGGSWYGYADNCRSADRYWFDAVDRSDVIGFRVVRVSS